MIIAGAVVGQGRGEGIRIRRNSGKGEFETRPGAERNCCCGWQQPLTHVRKTTARTGYKGSSPGIRR